MRCLLSIYFNNEPLHVSSRLTAHHQEVLLCIYSSWYMLCVYVDWQLVWILQNASQHKCMTYNIRCIWRVVPPDDEQKACSKHVEINYWNKLKVNSVPCWFSLCGYVSFLCYGIEIATLLYLQMSTRKKVIRNECVRKPNGSMLHEFCLLFCSLTVIVSVLPVRIYHKEQGWKFLWSIDC
jgi:hypothetical protein